MLVNYPTAKNIENQTIELTFSIGKNKDKSEKIYSVIKHTNQAWGTEVLNLLKDKVAELIWVDAGYVIVKKIKDAISNIGLYIVALVFAVFVLINTPYSVLGYMSENSIRFAIESVFDFDFSYQASYPEVAHAVKLEIKNETYYDIAKILASSGDKYSSLLMWFSVSYLSGEQIDSLAQDIADKKT